MRDNDSLACWPLTGTIPGNNNFAECHIVVFQV